MTATTARPTSTTPPTTRARRLAEQVAPVLAWFFLGAGVMRLLPVPFDVALFEGWGLPGWFRTCVGLAELAVGALALRPGWRPVGLVGIGTVMVAAGTVHAVLGHAMVVAVPLNGGLALAAFATAWTLRGEVLDAEVPR